MAEEKIERLSEGIPSISEQKAQALADFIQQRIEGIVANYNARH
jgi:hypothetical protein